MSRPAADGHQPGQPLDTPFGAFRLQRYPARARETLQAWCTADVLLLKAAAEALAASDAPRVLVVNDDHGALAVPLCSRRSCTIHCWTDSALSSEALKRNLRSNDLGSVGLTPSTEPPPADIDLVIMRVPKQLAYFEYQLATLAATLPLGVRMIAGGMDKHLSPHTAELMECYVGPTERHRGQRKARLFSATCQGQREPVPSPARYNCAPLGAELESRANVFSQDRLDRGSELLVAQFARLAPVQRVIDLACGNGVLGLVALEARLAGEVVFCDESAMAVASARANLKRLRPDDLPRCEFHQGDGLRDYRGEAADLILCNPPFHIQHVVDDYAGRRLLDQAARHLKPEGQLCLVANRHLRYKPALTRCFLRADRLAQNSKFIVWLASEPRR